MIDFENQIFNVIALALRNENPTITITGEELTVTASDSTFPVVTVIQKSNTTMESMIDNISIENYSNVMFEVDVYTNLVRGKKAQAKSIMDIIDNNFQTLGFVRNFYQPLSNLADTTIYRLKARYKAVIGKDGRVYTS